MKRYVLSSHILSHMLRSIALDTFMWSVYLCVSMATISVAPRSSLILATSLFGRQTATNIIPIQWRVKLPSFVSISGKDEMFKISISRSSIALKV